MRQIYLLLALLVFTALSGRIAAEGDTTDVGKLPSIPELPDPFLLANGKRVSTGTEWARHRKALLDLVLRFEYGPLPPEDDRVTAEVLDAAAGDGSATERMVTLSMGPNGAVKVKLVLTIPAGHGPFPVIVRGDLCWGRVEPAIVKQVVDRGYILAEFDRTEVASDSAERTGVYAAYPDYHGGRLSAWAWGYHRVVDYLLSLSIVDRHRIVETGHSRGGKATLLAGATDPRVALTAPNNSGCGGAGCYRYQAAGSEDIAAITKNFPFWFAPGFTEFIGHVNNLPFDQHTVKALIAPRALLSTEGLGDLWGNPAGTQQSYVAAREVYEFLGAGDKIGIHFRPGGHMQGDEDWGALLDFADQIFFSKRSNRTFQRLEFTDLPAVYHWTAPEPSTH